MCDPQAHVWSNFCLKPNTYSHHAAQPCRLRRNDLSALRLFATKMKLTEREETLMHIWSYDPRPKRTVSTIIGSKDSVRAAAQVARGEIVFDFIQTTFGEKFTREILQGGAIVTLPGGFWPRCCDECFHRRYTDAFRKVLRRALILHITSLRRGATTFAGNLGNKTAQHKRSCGGSHNKLKCPELGQLLYDWFIDCLQRYRARIDSYLFCRQAQ